ncbi:MAG: flagellar type III secretion system protein FliR [Deltaproteobacteria bacterium]|jgi:flagellar biosynthetic protein FliR|nr:flagellar type III secretion system protein FliR [Deltaproteobacteria bacterium]
MFLPLETFEQLEGFFWILVRVGTLFFLLPLFGARNIPSLWKAGLSFVVAIVLTPVVPAPQNLPVSGPEIILGIAAEVLMGLILAITIRMFMAAAEMAGQFMSFQMGFSMASAIDPQTGAQSNVLTQFIYIFTLLLFFSMDGHHMFIRVMANSFYSVPINSISFKSAIANELIRAGSSMFLLGLKIAAPILVALFLSNLCLGIIARTVPQVNILMVGFPVNLSIGFMLFCLILLNVYPLIFDMKNSIGRSLVRLLGFM